MAKSTKNAALICIVITGVAVIGIVIGIWKNLPVLVIAAMLPAVGYEVYRTEGFMTKLASWGMLALLIVEIILVIAGVKLDLSKYIGGIFAVDVKLIGSVGVAVLAVMLIKRTEGIYTKWLAAVIFISACALFYVIDPALFSGILNRGVQEGTKRIK